ncbi:MAG: dapF3, partial [Actinomycetia bacterium]|nr:dapF3 [Actinomycetes bacterium]
MHLVKTHGSLNEIFAAEATPDSFESGAELRDFVRRVCDRGSWTGGSDGIYFYDTGTAGNAQAWFFNPD